MRHHLYSVLLLLALVATATTEAIAGLENIRTSHWVRNISMDQGLPHNYVDDIFRDSMGFVWVATSGSLSRYDGYGFVDFHSSSLARNIKSAHVRKVAEDRFGRLWVANDGGIDVIDLQTLDRAAPVDKTGKFNDLMFIPSGHVAADNNGDIWLRNLTDVVYVGLDDDGDVETVVTMPHKVGTMVNTSAVKPVDADDDGVWTSIGNKVCHLSVAGGTMRADTLKSLPELSRNVYIADYAKYNGDLWVATDQGLYCCRLTDGGVVEYHGGDPGMGLSQNYVTSLAVTTSGDLVAGSLKGLNILDKASGKFSQVKSSDIGSFPGGMGNDFINCLFADGDNLWVGTEGCGIDLIIPQSLNYELFRHNPASGRSISPHPVNAIFEDGNATLWIGTVEGGLNRSFSRNAGFDHFTMQTGTLPHNSVSAITADQEGRLWVGTWGGGVCAVSRSNPAEPLMSITGTTDGQEQISYIGSLQFDPINNLLWIGANVGLFVYDPSTGEVRRPFAGSGSVKGSVASVISTDGKLWIGGLNGLFIIDLKRKKGEREFSYDHKAHKLDNPESKVAEKIASITESRDGTMWIGTNGNGLYRRKLVNGKEKYVNYNTAGGLANNVVHGIVEDLAGNLWIATSHGLSCILKDTFTIRNFGKDNGLATQQFYWNAACRLANGDILFGSVDGLLLIKGLSEVSATPSFPVVFTSISTDSGNEYLGRGNEHEIHEREKRFEVSFSSLDYVNIREGHYLYRLDGFDKGWNELAPGRHSVAYTNLSPGSYCLQVKYVAPGASSDGSPVSEFKLSIVPYFYKQWWFITLMILMALCGVWTVYRWRVSDLTRQRNLLKKTVDDRVREINEHKDLIEANALELTRQNDELKQSNRKITEQNEEISKQNEELKARNREISEQKAKISDMARTVRKMTVDRVSFFTNITHEFRTPITLIIGPIERAKKLSTNPKVVEQLNFVERNSKYLLSLVNQLMDFRKVESGKMDIALNKGNFRKFIDELVPPFRVFAEERDIELRTVCHLVNPVFSYDEEALRKVMTNLIGNAIKFTPDHGRITVYVSLFKSARCGYPNTLYISVSDSGCGISEEDTDKVFDRFYQGKSSIKYPLIGSSDSGIGLYLCKSIVEVYGGKIMVRNNHGAGCSFRVLLGVPENFIEPADRAAESSDRSGVASGAAHVEGEEASGESLTVLVVEDNADMRGFIRSILCDTYSVVEAANGVEAMRILLSTNVDFIISDLMMPEMDGMELSRQVKGNFAISHIPFLMLTAKTSNESRLEGYRTGVDEYLLKPFNEDILLARIRNIIDNKRRYQRQFRDNMEVDRLNITEETGDKKFIDRVMEVVRDNYQNSYFEVADFAEALGVSRSLLNKKLNSLLGESPNQFIRTYRLKIARELIIKNRTTKMMNISEIAFEVGFNDSKYFTRCFSKQYGVSPSSMLKE